MTAKHKTDTRRIFRINCLPYTTYTYYYYYYYKTTWRARKVPRGSPWESPGLRRERENFIWNSRAKWRDSDLMELRKVERRENVKTTVAVTSATVGEPRAGKEKKPCARGRSEDDGDDGEKKTARFGAVNYAQRSKGGMYIYIYEQHAPYN